VLKERPRSKHADESKLAYVPEADAELEEVA
jgi:hypothetical protein